MMIARATLLGPIAPNKAADQVVKRISEAISTGVLKPGEQLPVESELASQFNVAQMTLRQALGILRELGFIETVRGRNGGSFVTSQPASPFSALENKLPTQEDLFDLITFQMAVENEAAALAAIRGDRIAIGNIREQLESCLKSEPNSIQHWIVDNALHVSIAEATKSKKLIKSVTEVKFESVQIFLKFDFQNEHDHSSHRQEHIEIVEAVEAGNADGAWEASNNHLLSLHKYMSKIIDQKQKS